MTELFMRAVEPKAQAKCVGSLLALHCLTSSHELTRAHAHPPPLRVRFPADVLARDEAIAKTYTRLMWRRAHVSGRDLNRKLRLKWAAIHALPTHERRVEALVVDPFVPFQLRVPTFTPPLAGFHGAEERERAAAAAAAAAAEAEALSGGKRRGGARGGYGSSPRRARVAS